MGKGLGEVERKAWRRQTDIYDTDIHAEGFAGEVGNVTHIVTCVGYRYQPMEDSSPYSGPSHELWVDGGVVDLDDVVDGEVEE